MHVLLAPQNTFDIICTRVRSILLANTLNIPIPLFPTNYNVLKKFLTNISIFNFSHFSLFRNKELNNSLKEPIRYFNISEMVLTIKEKHGIRKYFSLIFQKYHPCSYGKTYTAEDFKEPRHSAKYFASIHSQFSNFIQ